MEINQLAPLDLMVKNAAGEAVSLRSLLGKFVVLYFYPKNFTPGCTTEACTFRDANDELKALGAVVIGVSKDSPESHQKFSKEHRLNFTLWSDQKGELLEACGALGQKSMFGKTFLGIKRMTIILNPQGKVLKIYDKVKPESHPDEVLTYLKSQLK